MIRRCKTHEKRIQDAFADSVSAANKAHKAICALRNKVLAPVKDAERKLKALVSRFEDEQREAARKEEERLRELARKEAEEQRLKEAEELEAAGAKEQAMQLLEKPIDPPKIVVAPPSPKIEGISRRSIWRFRVVDKSKMPTDYLIPDEKKLRQYAGMMKADASIPGVEFWEETSVAARAE